MDSAYYEFSFRLVDLDKQFRHPHRDSQWANEYTDLDSGQGSIC